MPLPHSPSVADAAASSVDAWRPAARVPPAARAQQLADPSCLHPALWRAQAGGSGGLAGGEATWPSGFGLLDAELPGGGWPVRVLTELLLVQPGVGEIRLLAPLMAELARQGRSVMLFNPPATLNAAALVELGCPPGACLVVQASPAALPKRRPGRAPGTTAEAELCWAVEQALRSGQLGALLAWPGRSLRAEALRRLQLSAQAHTGPAFLLREAAAARQPSPAPLRLALQVAGPDELSLRLFKRRGPALAHPLKLALAPVLSDRARALALQPVPVATAAGSAPDRPDPPPGEVGLQRPRSPVRPAGPAGSAAGGMAPARAQNAAAPL